MPAINEEPSPILIGKERAPHHPRRRYSLYDGVVSPQNTAYITESQMARLNELEMLCLSGL